MKQRYKVISISTKERISSGADDAITLAESVITGSSRKGLKKVIQLLLSSFRDVVRQLETMKFELKIAQLERDQVRGELKHNKLRSTLNLNGLYSVKTILDNKIIQLEATKTANEIMINAFNLVHKLQSLLRAKIESFQQIDHIEEIFGSREFVNNNFQGRKAAFKEALRDRSNRLTDELFCDVAQIITRLGFTCKIYKAYSILQGDGTKHPSKFLGESYVQYSLTNNQLTTTYDFESRLHHLRPESKRLIRLGSMPFGKTLTIGRGTYVAKETDELPGFLSFAVHTPLNPNNDATYCAINEEVSSIFFRAELAKGDPSARFTIESPDFVEIMNQIQLIIQQAMETIIREEETLKKLFATKEEAGTDPLTGLENRGALNRTLEKIINPRITCNDIRTIAAAMLDLDKFKRFNEIFGHDFGDRVIVHFANLITKFFRGTQNESQGRLPRIPDFLFRMGGEEMLILIPNISYSDVLNRLDLFRKNLEDSGLKHTFSVQPQRTQTTDSYNHADVTDLLLQLAKYEEAELKIVYATHRRNNENEVPFMFRTLEKYGLSVKNTEIAPLSNAISSRIESMRHASALDKKVGDDSFIDVIERMIKYDDDQKNSQFPQNEPSEKQIAYIKSRLDAHKITIEPEKQIQVMSVIRNRLEENSLMIGLNLPPKSSRIIVNFMDNLLTRECPNLRANYCSSEATDFSEDDKKVILNVLADNGIEPVSSKEQFDRLLKVVFQRFKQDHKDSNLKEVSIGVRMTASIGFVHVGDKNDPNSKIDVSLLSNSAEALVRLADQHLDKVKKSGRNNVAGGHI